MPLQRPLTSLSKGIRQPQYGGRQVGLIEVKSIGMHGQNGGRVGQVATMGLNSKHFLAAIWPIASMRT